MNTRIHSFKVYLIKTVSGMQYWTFYSPTQRDILEAGDVIMQIETLWELLYKARDGEKTKTGKSVVKKSDLEFLFTELAGIGGLEKIKKVNR